MGANGLSRIDVIQPAEMAMLQEVLDQLLQEKDLSISDARAETLAAHVIDLFRSGIRDPKALKTMAG